MRLRKVFNQVKSATRFSARLLTATFATGLAVSANISGHAQAFAVTNIVSDGSVPAQTTDASFINPWGISASPTWWISAQGTGLNYVVPPAGTIAFKVIVPLAAQPTQAGLPSGSVTTAGSTGFVLPNGTAPNFFFSTLDGTISGWNSKLGTAGALSQIVVNNSTKGSAYTGLALLNTTGGSYLLAPNFSLGGVEVYNSTYQSAKLAGSFTDPNLPTGYFPFSIHVLGTQVIVAYAQHSGTTPPFRELVAPGAGIVDIFDNTGAFVSRAVTAGNLNAPWGVAFAPANFGIFSNDLLIGNFGDGKINAYDPKTFAYVGQLVDATGKSLAYAALWDLLTGGTTVTGSTGVSGGSTSNVYFTAGLAGEAHGLFAAISNTTVAGSTPTFGFTTASSAMTAKGGTSATVGVSVAPVNGFSGTVTLSCTGLPVGATCTFSPSQLTVAATAASSGTVTISTTAASAQIRPSSVVGRKALSTSLAFLLPFVALLGLRRRFGKESVFRKGIHAACLLAMLGTLLAVAGCADANPIAPVVPTPAGTANITMNATSGTITQTTTVALTVQ